MKTTKLIVFIACLLAPFIASASQMAPKCNRNNTGAPGEIGGHCSIIEQVEWNVVDLQNQVNNLQAQNWQLQQQVNQNKTVEAAPMATGYVNDDSRIFELENRVSIIENTVTYIQQNLIKPIQVSINRIRKLLRF